ncbi:hypothetical protein PGT21_017320 [Puccinia graminis f. sp. tritici]|uniref:Myb/SANT-like domain-containing protein n=1 Tax=Puccinia graminis f. sp. tritici TaxID=56615 RepID=A0A5B0RLZ9_PUCGR|nr:hypothetical protein PGT21_017320 [Puccinia graminis f. sp. tritici]KAA1126085.1 hypothetical protein PGTUg99_021752 [Puccinia graminis f. sp. tritici]
MPPKQKHSSKTLRAPPFTPGKKTPAPTARANLIVAPSLPESLTSVMSQTQDESQDLSTQDTSVSNLPESQMSAHQKTITCRWTDADDIVLVDCLKDEQALHPGTTNGFKAVSWVQAAKALEGSELVTGSKAKDPGNCKSRWGALKKLYLSFKSVANMSGAGWDESAKMVTLPASSWRDLKKNTSPTGRDISRWETRPFPLYHELGSLIDGNTANGDLMQTTADSDTETQRDVGNDVPNDMALDIEDDANEDVDEVDPLPTKSTPTATKRKRGSAMSPDVILTELKSMSSTLAESMQAPIPPLVFSPVSAPPSVLMQAVEMLQKESALENNQLFMAIEFLSTQANAEVYISLAQAIRPTWLRMKMGW